MPAMDQTAIMNEITRRVNDNIRRIRILEERIRNLDSRTNKIEESLIEQNKNINKAIQDSESGLKEVRDKNVNLEVDIQNFKKDLKTFVTKRDVREMEEFVTLISPMTTKYVTKKEVEQMIKQSKEEEL